MPNCPRLNCSGFRHPRPSSWPSPPCRHLDFQAASLKRQPSAKATGASRKKTKEPGGTKASKASGAKSKASGGAGGASSAASGGKSKTRTPKAPKPKAPRGGGGSAAAQAKAAAAREKREAAAAAKVAAQTPLTFEEKKSLSVAINKLDQDNLTRVVEIIQNRMPLGSSDEEIELDIDAMDNLTLRDLQRFIMEVSAAGGGGGAGSGGVVSDEDDDDDTERW